MQTGDVVRVKSTGKVGKVETLCDNGMVLVGFEYRTRKGNCGTQFIPHTPSNLEVVEERCQNITAPTVA